MPKRTVAGLIIIAIFILLGVAYKLLWQDGTAGALSRSVTVKGLIGSEKQGVFENEAVKTILLERYGIQVDYAKAGSIAMVKGDIAGQDFLFPGSQVAVEIFKTSHPKSHAKAENIFNSPIVMYSWDIVTQALLDNGIVHKENGTYYILNFDKLIQLIIEGKKWSDIGLSALYGKIIIHPTDPTKSNSGNQFSGLLANMLAGGDVVSEEQIGSYLDTIKHFFDRIGYMERSTGYLFEQFLTTGVGSKPIVVGYENQIIEYCLNDPQSCNSFRNKVQILYPEPTVWSAHTMIMLSEQGKKLAEALKDPEIQAIAWKNNGFRSGVVGVKNDPKVLSTVGIPAQVTKVIPMPSAIVMEQIVNRLSQ